MKKKIVSGALLALLFMGMVTLAFGIQFDNTEPITSKGSAVVYVGTLDTWYSYYANDTWHYPYDGAKIVESQWDLTIQGGKPLFFLKFIELNIWEEPPGAYETWKAVMMGGNVDPTPDGYIVTGISYWWKYEEFRGPAEAVITISETNLTTQFSMEIPGWLMAGSLTP